MKLFIFGHGYSANAITRELMPKCEWIAGTSRSESKLAQMQAQGLRAFHFDGQTQNPECSEAIRDATHILVSIGPDADATPPPCAVIATTFNKPKPSSGWATFLLWASMATMMAHG